MTFETDKNGDVIVLPLLSFEVQAAFAVGLVRLEYVDRREVSDKPPQSLQIYMTELQLDEFAQALSAALAKIRQPGTPRQSN